MIRKLNLTKGDLAAINIVLDEAKAGFARKKRYFASLNQLNMVILKQA
jgi:hypothetical protein